MCNGGVHCACTTSSRISLPRPIEDHVNRNAPLAAEETTHCDELRPWHRPCLSCLGPSGPQSRHWYTTVHSCRTTCERGAGLEPREQGHTDGVECSTPVESNQTQKSDLARDAQRCDGVYTSRVRGGSFEFLTCCVRNDLTCMWHDKLKAPARLASRSACDFAARV